MTDRRKGKRKKRGSRASARSLTVRAVPGEDAFELVHPPCAERRADDLEEVRAMLKAGEVDLAIDELRWLLEGCRLFLEAHKLLGEIALMDGDLPLARGHFARAYDLGLEAIPEEGLARPLPYARPANRAFFEAGRGLAQCLHHSNEARPAAEVVEQMLALDPSDPLELRELLGG
ncbi:MAG TPA: hypothetical protein VMY37_28500 [Thermoguttaceae bacterium]|nr:hypothetical protein [Thermoguttaceae bacterium]